MKISQNKKSKNKLTAWLIPTISALLLVGLYAGLAYAFNWWPLSSNNNNTPSQQIKDSPPSSQHSSDTPGVTDGNKKPIQNDPGDKNNEGNANTPAITGVINHKSVQNGTLSLRVTVDQSLNTGTCTLTLTQTSSQKKVVKSAAIIDNPSSSTCEGFDIPTSELGSGTWKIQIAIVGNGAHGELTSEVSI